MKNLTVKSGPLIEGLEKSFHWTMKLDNAGKSVQVAPDACVVCNSVLTALKTLLKLVRVRNSGQLTPTDWRPESSHGGQSGIGQRKH